MKRRKKKAGLRLLWPIVFALVLMWVFFVCASAEDAQIWEITSPSGEVTTSTDPLAFAGDTENAVYRLLANTLTFDSDVQITAVGQTIDLSGKTVVWNAATVRASGEGSVTVKADGANLFATSGIPAFTLKDDVEFSLSGGNVHGSVFLFANNRSDAMLSGVSVEYQGDGGYSPLIISDQSAVTVDSCFLLGGESSGALLSCVDGVSVAIDRSVLLSQSGKAVSHSGTALAKLSLSGSAMILGEISGFPEIGAEEGVRFDRAPIAPLSDALIPISVECTQHFTVLRGNSSRSLIDEEIRASFPYVSVGSVLISPEQTAASVWCFENAEGVRFYESIYTPFSSVLTDGKLTLLSDLSVPFLPAIRTDSSLALDLSGTRVTTYGVAGITSPLFTSSLDGSVTLTLSGTILSGECLFAFPNAASVAVEAPDAFLFCDAVLKAPQADVTVAGGYFDGHGDTPPIVCSSLSLTDCEAVCRSVLQPVCDVSGDLTLVRSLVAALNGGRSLSVGGVLTTDARSVIYGDFSTAEYVFSAGMLLAGKAEVARFNLILVEEETPYTLLTFRDNGIGVSASVASVTLTRRAVAPLSDLKASLRFGADLLLDLFVPAEELSDDYNTRVLISSRGILFEAKKSRGIILEIDGKYYYKFTYRYLAHDSAGERVKISLLYNDSTFSTDFALLDLLLASIERSDDKLKPTLATYLAFSFELSGIENAEDLLAPYAGSIGKESAQVTEDERFTDYIRGVTYHPHEGTLTLAFAQEFCGTVQVTYGYGDDTQTVSADASKVDVFDLPIYRYGADEPMCFVFSTEKGETKIPVGLLTFAVMSHDTLSSDMLTLYMSYLIELSK